MKENVITVKMDKSYLIFCDNLHFQDYILTVSQLNLNITCWKIKQILLYQKC